MRFSYQAHVRFPERSLRTHSNRLEIYPRFPRKMARIPSLQAIHTSLAPFLRNKSSKVSGEIVNKEEELGVSGALTMPHFSSLLAAKRYQSAALLRAPLITLNCAACASNKAASASSAWELEQPYAHQKPLRTNTMKGGKRTEPAAQTSHRSPSKSLLRKSCLVIPTSQRAVYVSAATSIDAG